MSGAFTRPRVAGSPIMRLPRLSGIAAAPDQVNAAFQIIETADSQNVKRGQEIAAPSILLQAVDGSTWRVTVDIGTVPPSLALALVPPRP